MIVFTVAGLKGFPLREPETITYTPKADEDMSALTEGDTYDWIAIGE